MSNPLDNLCGPGKPLQLEVPDANELAGLLRSGTARLKDARNLGEYEGLLDVDERLVTDLIAATQAVADALGK